ncbi:MAG TPA: formimidoylglutamate deiminase [Burkholderiaceae bacterium]|nr:formimidoylglutamate deiminase [Burkholderiaceae bacterium]
MTLLWTPRAWIGSRWRDNVALRIDANGRWSEIAPGLPSPPPGAQMLRGPLLPGLVNAHSHSFQRAFAGLAERRESDADDFWSWRDRMYRVALRITPGQLRAVAAHLFVELLRGGYTHVCEFHYLQHDPDGKAYPDPLALSWAVADAAEDAGIGLTMLPVLYERAGFRQPTLREDQRRFRTSPQSIWAARHSLATGGRALMNTGIAIHSLRAAAPESIAMLRKLAEGFDGPIHIHVAEQTAEVEDCLAATGARPIEWLARERLLDERWQLVHATHTVPQEIAAVAACRAGVVLCPSTEGNLGDGLCDLPGWLDTDVPITLGSDSHVTREWREELRWLDYGQRLVRRQRNVAAAPKKGESSTAQNLFARVLDGGPAAGERSWGLVPGARADALVVDMQGASLIGLPAPQLMDALVFSSPGRPWRDVLVGGQWMVQDHRHAAAERIARRFEAAMQEIWRGT